jgi:hypothetical protein
MNRAITRVLIALTTAMAALGAVTIPAAATTSFWVSGTVRCTHGSPVEGIWVNAAGGGWAAWQVVDREQYGAAMAYYWRQVTGPTTVSLHVGCGGSTGSWQTKDDTPLTGSSLSSGTPMDTTCAEAPGPEAVRCAPLARPSIGNRAADLALLYDGQWGGQACKAAHLGVNGYVGGFSGGQCRQFVNCLVYRASWHAYNPASANYSFTGATQISGSGATRGDIIQNGQGIHTAIVLQNLGGGKYVVVDSNFILTGSAKETVHVHNYTPPASGVTYWRYPQGATDQSGAPMP